MRAETRPSSPTTASSRCRQDMAGHRPQHGRQEHLPAPECVDRGAGPDGLVCARRRSPHRRGGSSLLPCGRGGRSGARPLDLMVEMVETAAILNQAGERALVILDEIGRGTATYDGLSIAWAAIEHLHDSNRCRSLFATHYHELTALAQKLDRLACHTMRIKEWQGKVVFLHEVAPGAADRSYGIPRGAPRRLARGGACPRRGGAGAARTRRQGQCCRPARQRPAALPGPPAGGARPGGTGARSAAGSPCPDQPRRPHPPGMRWSSSTRFAPGSGTMRPRTERQPCAGIRSGPSDRQRGRARR